MSRTWTRRSKMSEWDNPETGFNKMVSDQEFKSCTRKLGVYKHENEAWAAIRKLNAESPLETYKCPHCKKWHLTRKRSYE